MATLSDIAKIANVSDMTVSRVLNGKMDYRREVFAKRAAKIRKIAREVGYRPNGSAVAIRSGRFNAVALLLTTVRTWSILPDGLLAGIRASLAQRDLHLMIDALADQTLTDENQVPKLLRQLCSDGLLINYNSNIPAAMIRLIESYQVPSVWMNSKQPHDAVHPDDFTAAREATDRLLRMGHSRIVYMDFHTKRDGPCHYSQIDRDQGYEQAILAGGHVAQRIGSTRLLNAGLIVNTCRELLAAPDRPTAVIAYGAQEARAVAMAAALENLAVPRDLSIVCFADTPQQDLGLKFATALIPEYDLGRAAVEMLLQRIGDDPQGPLPTRAIPFGFDPQQTLGQAASSR